MPGHPNFISGLGIAWYSGHQGHDNVSLELGEFGAVVIGRNGSGKTRLISKIGDDVDLIYETALTHHLFSLVDLNSEEQPWDVGDTFGVPSEDNFYFENPQMIYREVLAFLDSPTAVLEERLSAVLSGDVRIRVLALAETTRSKRRAVAAVFAALNCSKRISTGDVERISDRPDFPYVLVASEEIWGNGRLGLSRTRDWGKTKLRIWYNVTPDTTPCLIQVLEALDTYEGVRVQIDENGLSYPNGEPTVSNQDLHDIALEPLIELPRERFPGTFEFSTKKLPIGGFCSASGVYHEGSSDQSKFEGLWIGSVREPRGVSLDRGMWCSFERSVPGPELDFEGDEEIDVDVAEPSDAYQVTEHGSAIDEASGTTHEGPEGAAGGSVYLDPPVYKWDEFTWFLARSTSHVANKVLRILLPSSEDLELFDIEARLTWRLGGRPLAELSRAEQRWANFAVQIAERFLNRLTPLIEDTEVRTWIELALRDHDPGVSEFLPGCLVTIDEPESGLHRGAEAQLTKGILRLALLCGFKPVVATHSPIVIREMVAAGANLFSVSRSPDGSSTVEVFHPDDVQNLGQVAGVSVSDLLHLVRAFLIVEGEHDFRVINAVMGQELHDLGVRVIPMRGAKGVSQVVDSAFLWNFSEAKVWVLLDSLNMEVIEPIWLRAKYLASVGSTAEATQHLGELDLPSSGGSTERKALRELLTHAVTANRFERISIFGLSERDILEYFSPDSLIMWEANPDLEASLHDRSWASLKRAWRKSGDRSDFKSWLQHSFPGTRITAEGLAEIASGWDHIPNDLTKILVDCRDRLTT